MNRRTLYNRASADPDGKPWSERKALRVVGRGGPEVDRARRARLRGRQGSVRTGPPEGASGPDGLAGDDPFIMQADGKGWLYAPAGLLDGPMPTHYEPAESPVSNPMYRQQANPTREVFPREDNLQNPSGDEPGAELYPYVFTTYRLTEHHTAGGMSRFQPYLSELQPEFFCEVSPELARERGLENNGWATIISARTAIEARVLVTERVTPLRVAGRTVHQIGLPYHWGVGNEALVTGDSANDLFGVTLDAERAHPGDQGRPPATSSPAGARAVPPCWSTSRRTGRGPAITTATGNLQRTPPEGAERAARPGPCSQHPRRRGRDTPTKERDEPADEPQAVRRGGSTPARGSDQAFTSVEPGGPAVRAGWGEEPPPRKGFFTDTSICIGCKACEVACKEWNGVPQDGIFELLGSSYDNTGALGASTWRHVEFIEQRKPLGGQTTGVTIGVPETATGGGRAAARRRRGLVRGDGLVLRQRRARSTRSPARSRAPTTAASTSSAR